MTDEPYTKRELDTHFSDVKETLTRIEKQTVKTNGRVTKLEIWRGVLIGAWIVLNVIVIPLLTYTYIQQIDELKTIIRNNTNAIRELNETRN